MAGRRGFGELERRTGATDPPTEPGTRCGRIAALDVLVDWGRGLAGSEVSAVTAQDLDPLLARLVDGVR